MHRALVERHRFVIPVVISTLAGACIPPAMTSQQPTATSSPAETTTAQQGPVEAPPPAPPQLTLKPSGFVMTRVDTKSSRRLVELDVTAEQLTEVWIRTFNDEGMEIHTRDVQLCDPNAPQSCERAKSAGALIVGIAGTRRVKMYFDERGHGGSTTIQLVTDHRRLGWSELVFDAPADDAPLADRNIARHGVPEHLVSSSWVGAAGAFKKLPRSFIVYATSGFPAGKRDGAQRREIVAGEPLVRVGSYLLRANGEVVVPHQMRGVSLDSLLSATRPEAIVMPPAWTDEDGGRSDVSMYHYPYGDDVAELDGFDAPERDAFLKAREPVKACIGRELEKRGSGFGYDVAIYKKDGTIKKVQSLTSYIEEQVYKTCKVAKLDKQRAALRVALRARALAEIKDRLSAP